jgi:serine/threonine protein kinase
VEDEIFGKDKRTA